ncbi:hypothetical protein Bca101_020431 [Brassica carinata]
MKSESSLFPSASVGSRVKPCLFSDDPFSSPISSWERTLGTDDEEATMAPLKQRRSYLLDDGPRSRVRGKYLIEIRNRYAIPPSVGIRNPSDFERAPDGGVNEVTIYEAYLEAGVRSGVPSLVAEVSSYFGFCPSQLTPLSWRTLMAIQVLGELRGFHIGVHEVLYSYCFAPLANKPEFYFLRARDGAPLVGERSRDVSRPVSFAGEAVAKLVNEIPLQFRWVSFLVSKEALRHSHIWASVVGLPLSAFFQNYQGVKAKRRRYSFNLPTRLARAAASASGPSPLPSVDAKVGIDYSLLEDIHQKLLADVSSLCGQVQDMMAHRDRLIQQVRVATRWRLMKEWLEERTGCWNPGEEYRRYLSLFGRPSMEPRCPAIPTSAGSRTLAE